MTRHRTMMACTLAAMIAAFGVGTALAEDSNAADSNDEGAPTKPATPAERQLAADVLKIDSQYWTRMTYDPKTLRNFYTYDDSYEYHYIHAEYRYETPDGPGWGWVDINTRGEKPNCLIYWDSHGACDVFRSPEYFEAYHEREMQRRKDDRQSCIENASVMTRSEC